MKTPDLGVSFLLPASMKRWQANLLDCKESKTSDPSWLFYWLRHFTRSPGDSSGKPWLRISLQGISTDVAFCLIAFLSLLSLSCLIITVVLSLGSRSWFFAPKIASDRPLFPKPTYARAGFGSSLFHATEPRAILTLPPTPPPQASFWSLNRGGTVGLQESRVRDHVVGQQHVRSP